MAEERINELSEVVAEIADTMGKKLDEHGHMLTLQSQQIVAVSNKLDEQEITLYEHGAIMRAHSRDIREIKVQLATMNQRQDVMDKKLDQIISLLTPQAE